MRDESRVEISTSQSQITGFSWPLRAPMEAFNAHFDARRNLLLFSIVDFTDQVELRVYRSHPTKAGGRADQPGGSSRESRLPPDQTLARARPDPLHRCRCGMTRCIPLDARRRAQRAKPLVCRKADETETFDRKVSDRGGGEYRGRRQSGKTGEAQPRPVLIGDSK